MRALFRLGPRLCALGAMVGVTFLPAGCARLTGGGARTDAPETLGVPRLPGEARIDGQLDEPCYQIFAALARFGVAGEPDARPQPTRAWLFWSPGGLVFAFDATDADVVAAPASSREHNVDAQDRVEVFLWSGRTNDTYYCIEVGARGAVHDYAARFYRRFDDAWSPAGMEVAAVRTPAGYRVEGLIPGPALRAAGFRLRPGERWRCGLFRADFRSGQPGSPSWICWVDARGPQPDFHVAGSFGEIRLEGARPATSPP